MSVAVAKQSVLVWQRGRYRIVAASAIDDENGETIDYFVLERGYCDAMNVESWSAVDFPLDEQGEAIDFLLLEIASRIDTLPPWVRTLIRTQRADFDEESTDGSGSAA